MYAMQGTMSVGAFVRSLGNAKAPWLTVDAAAESRRQEHCGETGRFLSGALVDEQREPQARIDKCMNCPYPECRNCWESKKDRRHRGKRSAQELADSLRLRRCEEV